MTPVRRAVAPDPAQHGSYGDATFARALARALLGFVLLISTAIALAWLAM